MTRVRSIFKKRGMERRLGRIQIVVNTVKTSLDTGKELGSIVAIMEQVRGQRSLSSFANEVSVELL